MKNRDELARALFLYYVTNPEFSRKGFDEETCAAAAIANANVLEQKLQHEHCDHHSHPTD